MKTIIKFKRFQRECETAEDLVMMKKKLLELNNGKEIKITLKLNGEQRAGMGNMGFKFAENLVEGIK